MALNLSDYSATAIGNALLSSGYLNGATFTIYAGTQPANGNTAVGSQIPLVALTLANPGGTISKTGGVITLLFMAKGTAINAGTASFFRISNGSNTIADGSIGATAGDLIIPNSLITFAVGATVDLTGLTFTITE